MAGLYHVRHRAYDLELGRWTRRDPIGYVDGMGLYEYTHSQPIGWVDPLGLLRSRAGGSAMESAAIHPSDDLLDTSPQFASVCCWNYIGLSHCEIVIGQSCSSASGG